MEHYHPGIDRHRLAEEAWRRHSIGRVESSEKLDKIRGAVFLQDSGGGDLALEIPSLRL